VPATRSGIEVVCPSPVCFTKRDPAMSDPSAADVQQYIAAGLPCTHLEVEGDGQHFFATIVSAEFEGKTRIGRHQRVYQALGDRMKAQIHALSMKTFTPDEWARQA